MGDGMEWPALRSLACFLASGAAIGGGQNRLSLVTYSELKG